MVIYFFLKLSLYTCFLNCLICVLCVTLPNIACFQRKKKKNHYHNLKKFTMETVSFKLFTGLKVNILFCYLLKVKYFIYRFAYLFLSLQFYFVIDSTPFSECIFLFAILYFILFFIFTFKNEFIPLIRFFCLNDKFANVCVN